VTYDRPVPLDRPIYQMNEAARLLGIPDKTLRRWIDGDRRFDTIIEPLIRPEHTGCTDVTWGEFVEAGLLSQYRHRVLPIERLRPLATALREMLQTPYPLAHARPLYSGGRELLWREQQNHGIGPELFLVVQGPLEEGYQLVLTDVAARFVSRVAFEPPETGVVAKWYPLGPDRTRIALDPRVSFGLPTINGIRTEVLAELRAAGESDSAILEVYATSGISLADIEEAVTLERSLRVAA
jgi:uncharacterized protein (DUF433 family)